jgi:hypothetical protein
MPAGLRDLPLHEVELLRGVSVYQLDVLRRALAEDLVGDAVVVFVVSAMNH